MIGLYVGADRTFIVPITASVCEDCGMPHCVRIETRSGERPYILGFLALICEWPAGVTPYILSRPKIWLGRRHTSVEAAVAELIEAAETRTHWPSPWLSEGEAP